MTTFARSLALLAFLSCFSLGLIAADKKEADKFHFALLGDAPPMFNANGEKVTPKYLLSQKYVILYFSASWCGPCHKFNPSFFEWYKANGGGKNVEVILVGSDTGTDGVKAYMKEQKMPWLAFEQNGKQFDAIKAKYGAKGIPHVVLLNEKDEVLASSYVDGKYVGPMAPLKKYEELIKGGK